MNKKRLLFLIFIFVLTILVVAVFSKGSAKTIAKFPCTNTRTHLRVLIKNSVITPYHTNGQLCDTMTIVNEDNNVRLIAFGPHEHHTPYDGITEEALGQNQSLTVTLDQVGNYQFHDHLNDQVKGTFSVKK